MHCSDAFNHCCDGGPAIIRVGFGVVLSRAAIVALVDMVVLAFRRAAIVTIIASFGFQFNNIAW